MTYNMTSFHNIVSAKIADHEYADFNQHSHNNPFSNGQLFPRSWITTVDG